jgi:glycosyltransferase involved in cell wall biosynthesis
MKLLMLGWELPPYNSGGMGVASLKMAKALAQMGKYDIKFVVPYNAKHPEAEQYFDVIYASDVPPVMDEHGDYLAMGAYAGICSICNRRDCEHSAELGRGLVEETKRYARNVTRALKKRVKNPHYRKPDIIHVHDWLTLLAGTGAKQVCGAPLVVHVHATEFERAGGSHGNPLIWEIEYNGFRAADRIFAVSQHTKDIIVKEYDIPADKVEVVYNSLDMDGLTHTVTETNNYLYIKELKKHGFTVVGINSRLTIMKGVPYFIEAAALALSRNPKLVFVILSSGEMRNQLIELTADLGIADRVIFVGFVRGQRWREFYELIDIFAMPSLYEPYGLTALEAAHYHTAVLLSKTSGVGEILNSVMRFDYWDTRKLADQIVNISLSPGLRAELTDGVAREYMKISWTDVANKLTREYERTLRNFQSRHKEPQHA